MRTQTQTSRRHFLKSTLLGGAAALVPWSLPRSFAAEAGLASNQLTSRVALNAGDDRADVAFKGLKAFEKQIAAAIGNKRVIIKPNNVAIDNQLSASHAANLEGILEFLKAIGKTNVVIAESAANGPTLDGFANYGYNRLAQKYGVRLMDLDQEGFEVLHCFDENDFRPHPCRMSKVLLDPNNFIISAAKFKTHDRVVATLSLKNIVVGAPIKDPGFRWGPGAKPGAKNDKPLTHGSGFRGINYNLYALAPRLHPHLAVIDGFEGMEGEGPVGGTPVNHRVCVVSPDWLAADRVAIELMGIDFTKVGYLNFCGQTGLGESDLSKIEILGPALKDHIKSYKLAKNIDQQLIWRQPVKKG
ncbi:MAG TPA: DUF362 domain-containing protein [Candidatus Sulfotelmatobacter sp.]|nr:DUF362 domain-containing protein [Candidatus Sulfotelmatobacter sp.]